MRKPRDTGHCVLSLLRQGAQSAFPSKSADWMDRCVSPGNTPGRRERCFHSALLDRKAPICRDESGAPLAHECDKAPRPRPLPASSLQPGDRPLRPPCLHLGLDTRLEQVHRGDATARDAHLLTWITERASASLSACGRAQQALPNATWELGKVRQKRRPGWAVRAPAQNAGHGRP